MPEDKSKAKSKDDAAKKKKKQSVWKTYLASQVMRPDGTPYSANPSEPLSKIRVRGFLATERVYAWEVEGAGWEYYAGGQMRRPAKKFFVVAHVGPIKYGFDSMCNSLFLDAMADTLCNEIKEYTELGNKWVHDGHTMEEFSEFLINRRKGNLL